MKPHVICHMMVSLDGRIHPSRWTASPDGNVKDWILEGGAPGNLVRDGMTSKSLVPGDEITATINPLHSGADGGSYQPALVKFKDGRPISAPR